MGFKVRGSKLLSCFPPGDGTARYCTILMRTVPVLAEGKEQGKDTRQTRYAWPRFPLNQASSSRPGSCSVIY